MSGTLISACIWNSTLAPKSCCWLLCTNRTFFFSICLRVHLASFSSEAQWKRKQVLLGSGQQRLSLSVWVRMFPQAQHCCDTISCRSPRWENCTVPSAGGVSCGRGSVLSLSLSMFSLSSDKSNHQPFPSEFRVCAHGMCLFAHRVTNLRLHQASVSFTAWGHLQTLNNFSGLVLYILEWIFTNHCTFCFGGQVSSCCSVTDYCCYGKGSIAFSTANVPPVFLCRPCPSLFDSVGFGCKASSSLHFGKQHFLPHRKLV